MSTAPVSAAAVLAVCVVATVVAVLGWGLPGPDAPVVVATDDRPDAAPDPAPTGPTGGFTLGALAAGEVSPQQFAAFWEAELERIAQAPCASAGPQATVVVVTLGATPPSELGAAYTDYGPAVVAARAAAAERCS